MRRGISKKGVRRRVCGKECVERGVEMGMWVGACRGVCLLWKVACAGWSEIEGMDELPFPICEIVLPGLCLN